MDAVPLLHQQLEGCRDLSLQLGRAARLRALPGSAKLSGFTPGWPNAGPRMASMKWAVINPPETVIWVGVVMV